MARARAIVFSDAVDSLRVPKPIKGKPEYEGPCPRCGGNDRFAVNRKKAVWICRGCSAGGRDGISLAAHILHLDLKSRAGFLEACSAVLEEPIPMKANVKRMKSALRARRALPRRGERAQANRRKDEEQTNAFRENEIRKARGFWLYAIDCTKPGAESARAVDLVRSYLKARTGFEVPLSLFTNIACGRAAAITKARMSSVGDGDL